MKRFKLTNGIQIILLTLFVLVIGTIIVGVTFDSKASAATKPCGDPNCPGILTCYNYSVGTHRWNCNVCSYIEQESCSGGAWYHKSGTSVHQKFCWACGYYYAQESCYDNDSDGSCDANCGNTGMHTHSYSSKTVDNGNGTHSVIKTCSCGDSYTSSTSNHTWGSYSVDGNGHSAKCTSCTAKNTGTHEGATHANGGKCTVCKNTYQTHSQTTEIKEYKKSADGHTPVYTCSYSKCTGTFDGTLENHTGGNHDNDGKCTLTACGYHYQIHGQSTEIKEYKKSADGHTPVYACTESSCTITFDGNVEDHTGATHENGGICTVEGCGYTYQKHEQTTTIKEYIKSEEGHIPVYTCSCSGCVSTYEGTLQGHVGGKHSNNGICTVEGCGYQYQEHGQSTKVKEYETTDTTHTPIYECTESSCSLTYVGQEDNHKDGTHENQGVCSVCELQYQTHRRTTTIKEYEKLETGHVPVYTCEHSGCPITYADTTHPEAHTGGTHENDGECTVCTYQYQIHGQSETIKEYIKSKSGHTPVYKCTELSCTTTYEGTEENHSGATHENGGICTVEGCGYKYDPHSQSTTIKEYQKTESGHAPIYTCINSSCEKTYIGEEDAHVGGTHENEGICTFEGCGYKYQLHEKTTYVKEYFKTETGHTPIYYCKQPGCEEIYEGTEAKHKGATHENGGTCIIEGCEYQYEIHSPSTEVKEYKTSEIGHTPVYTCTNSGCTGTYDGQEEIHEGGTHENDGKCTVEGCGYQYEQHTQSTEIKEYKKTETGHTPMYKCSMENCGAIYDGEEEAHTGATHENEGKCTVEGCGYQYDPHGQSTEIKEYEKSETGHTPVYTCIHVVCEITYEGEEELHTGGTHENGGICTVEGCGYQYQEHGQSTNIKEYNKTETGHTPIYTCIHIDCETTYEGEEELHTGASHENGGTCIVEGCGYQYAPHKQSTEIKEYDVTEEGHTPIYKCTNEECEETFKGEEENHTVEKWDDNGDGKHSGNCTICDYKAKEIHKYENEECEDCRAKEPEKECEHTYVEKSDKDNHWEECSKCGEEKEGSKEPHNYKKYTDNEDGTHSSSCTECEYEQTEKHNYEDGKCEDCEVTEPEEKCDHTYVEKSDKDNHWEECTECREEKEGSKEPHNYGEYISNGDGTHSSTCTKCKYKLTEKHKSDGNCEYCGEKVVTTYPGNKDNTTADKEIPKAGFQSIVIMLIIAIGTILTLSIFKINKYKDI